MRLTIEVIQKPARNGPGWEAAIYADEEGIDELISTLQQARDYPAGLAYNGIGNTVVHVFRTYPGDEGG